MKATAIILAAGESRRMGVPKALLAAADGHTFVSHLAATFVEAGAAPLVVTGKHAAEIAAAHPWLPMVVNEEWPDGQWSSVKAGLRAALAAGATHVLIHPVDIPAISVSTVRAVLDALAHHAAVVVHHAGTPAHPLGLSAEAACQVLRARAQTLEKATGALSLHALQVNDAAVIDNLNTPEAYSRRFGHNPAPGVTGGPASEIRGRSRKANEP